jgi:hypothetical protein
MNSQPFNCCRSVRTASTRSKREAEPATKGHFQRRNSTEEALRRPEYIASQGSRYIMHDFSPPALLPPPTC